MNRRKIGLSAAMAAAFALAGCGDGFDESTRFNRSLGGGTASIPVSGAVDVSILSDPANYTPAQFDPIVPVGGASAPAVDANPEVAAIQDLSRRLQTAVFNGEIDALLDCFPDDKVEALRDSDFPVSADELVTTIRDLWSLVGEKSADTDLAVLAQAPQLITMFGELSLAGEKVEMISETEAMLVPDAERLQAQAEAMRPQLVPAFEKLAAAIPAAADGLSGEDMYEAMIAQMVSGADMAEAMPGMTELSRVIKVDGEWRRDLPITLTVEHAEAINGAVLVLSDFLDQITDQVDALDKLDTESLELLQGQLMIPAMGMAGGVMTELQPLISDLGGDGGSGATAGPAPSFSEDILPIMIDRCAFCHQPGGRAERAGVSLDLQAENAYVALVNADSETDNSLVLVVPGDVTASYLYAKLSQESPPHGRQMPAGDDPLTDDELDLFRRWIEAGALNDLDDSGEDPANEDSDAGDDDEDASGDPRIRGGGGG